MLLPREPPSSAAAARFDHVGIDRFVGVDRLVGRGRRWTSAFSASSASLDPSACFGLSASPSFPAWPPRPSADPAARPQACPGAANTHSQAVSSRRISRGDFSHRRRRRARVRGRGRQPPKELRRFGHRRRLVDDDRDLAPEIEAQRREGQAADDDLLVVDEHDLAVRFQLAETLGRKQVDRQPARPLFVEHGDEIGIRELGVDDTDARPRALNQMGELTARSLRSDDEALADIRGHRQPGAVRFHQATQTGDHVGVVRQDERVACLAKTFLREVQRRHERRSIVGDQVLRVVLHDRIGVRLDGGARPLERAPQLRELFLAALRARRDEHFDGDAATHGRCQFREHLVVVATEERECDALPSLTDHIQHGLAPLLDGHDEPVGRYGILDRRHDQQFTAGVVCPRSCGRARPFTNTRDTATVSPFDTGL